MLIAHIVSITDIMHPTILERLKWLRNEQHLPLQCEIEDSSPIVRSVGATLTECVIRRIFSDASDEVLLRLNRFLKEAMRQRSKPVKLALSLYNASFEDRCASIDLKIEVYKPLIIKYFSLHQPSWVINDVVVDLIARYLADENFLEDPTEYAARIVGCGTIEMEDIIASLMSLCEDNDNEGVGAYDEFFSMAVDNPHFIAAVERLIAQGKPPKHICIITINLPLGKKIKQCFDMRYGDYVDIVDDDYVGVVDDDYDISAVDDE